MKKSAVFFFACLEIALTHCSSEVTLTKNAKDEHGQSYAQSVSLEPSSPLVCCDIGHGYTENERYYLMLAEMVCKENGIISHGNCGEDYETKTSTSTTDENIFPCTEYEVQPSDTILLPSSFDISHCQTLSDEGNSICDGLETSVWICSIKVIQKDEIYCTYWKKEACDSNQRCETTKGICISSDPENEYP